MQKPLFFLCLKVICKAKGQGIGIQKRKRPTHRDQCLGPAKVQRFLRGCSVVDELRAHLGPRGCGWWGNGDVQIFLVRCENQFSGSGFHRKRVGLNHVAFRAESKEEVDRFYKQFLAPKRVTVLYDGPRVHPEYGPSYYAVYFEDPDRIKLEFVHGIE